MAKLNRTTQRASGFPVFVLLGFLSAVEPKPSLRRIGRENLRKYKWLSTLNSASSTKLAEPRNPGRMLEPLLAAILRTLHPKASASLPWGLTFRRTDSSGPYAVGDTIWNPGGLGQGRSGARRNSTRHGRSFRN